MEAREGDAVSDGADVLVGEVLGVVGAGGEVAGEHAKAFGEGFYVCGVVAAAFVIYCHALVGDFFEGAVGVVVVELGGPVGGFVFLDFAGGAAGLLEGGVGGIEANVWKGGELSMLTFLWVLAISDGLGEHVLEPPAIL